MPMHPPSSSAGDRPAGPDASGRLGVGEACVLSASIAAVTVLAILQRPIPAVVRKGSGCDHHDHLGGEDRTPMADPAQSGDPTPAELPRAGAFAVSRRRILAR
ncbi:hypothetical protein AB0D11_47630 [Streptomyces monashensis]|uniref:hypothetical protein n=1 Tax=Streptomyces monashensis TaxID=1678012 RepID=UPI00340DC796